MVHDKGWDSIASRVSHLLGALYYLFHWLIILGGVGVITAFLSHLYLNAPVLLSFTVIVLSVLSIGWGISFWLKANKRRFHGNNPSLQILECHDYYQILDVDRSRNTRRIKAKVLRDGVEYFSHKFQWTGKGLITVETTNSQLRAELKKDHRGIREECRIYFESPKRQGEIVDIAWTLNLQNENHVAKPYLSSTINDWVKEKVSLTAQFPDPGFATSYRKQIFMSGVADIPVWEKIVVEDGIQVASWIIPRPRPSYRYQIDWKNREHQ